MGTLMNWNLFNGTVLVFILGGMIHAGKTLWWSFPNVEAKTLKNSEEISDLKKISCKIAIKTIKDDEELIEICSK